MNKLLSVVVFCMSFVNGMHAEGGGTSANSPAPTSVSETGQTGITYYIIPFQSYQLEDGLPPRVSATFQIKCFEQFVAIVRHRIETDSGKVIIAIGALVHDLPGTSVCSSAEDITVDAGHAFSGRDYEIVPIGNWPSPLIPETRR